MTHLLTRQDDDLNKLIFQILSAAYFGLLGVALSACQFGGTDLPHIKVGFMEFADEEPFDFDVAAYQAMLDSRDGSYRETPLGEPVFGSVFEWFDFVSEGRVDFTTEWIPKVNSEITWEWVAAQQQLFKSSNGEEGEWWVHSLDQAYSAALADRVGERSVGGSNEVLILFHNKRGRQAWIAGKFIVLPAQGFSGDIAHLGIVIHELSHGVLGNYQSDRYPASRGRIGSWDVMASDYGQFPVNYNGAGRIKAGWASYVTSELGQNSSFELEPLHGATELHRLPMSLLASAPNSFLRFEWRTDQSTTDGRVLEVPQEGLMLYQMTDQNPRAMIDDLVGSDVEEEIQAWTVKEWYEERGFGVFGPEEQSKTVPQVLAGLEQETAVGLNTLGEQIWSVDFDGLGGTIDEELGFLGERVGVQARWLPTPVRQVGTVIRVPSGNQVMRGYFWTRRALRLETEEGELVAQIPRPAGGLSTQVVLDVNPQESGQNLIVVEGRLDDSRAAWWVSRPQASPAPSWVGPIKLRGGAIFANPVATLTTTPQTLTLGRRPVDPGRAVLPRVALFGDSVGMIRMIFSYSGEASNAERVENLREALNFTVEARDPVFADFNSWSNPEREVTVRASREDWFTIEIPVFSFEAEFDLKVSREGGAGELHLLSVEHVLVEEAAPRL